MKESLTLPMAHAASGKTKIKSAATPWRKGYNKLLAEFKSQQTGYAAIAIIAQSCIGSVAAMTLLMNDWYVLAKMGMLGLVTLLCMAYNAAVLAQLKSELIFNLLAASIIFSSVVIIANLI